MHKREIQSLIVLILVCVFAPLIIYAFSFKFEFTPKQIMQVADNVNKYIGPLTVEELNAGDTLINIPLHFQDDKANPITLGRVRILLPRGSVTTDGSMVHLSFVPEILDPNVFNTLFPDSLYLASGFIARFNMESLDGGFVNLNSDVELGYSLPPELFQETSGIVPYLYKPGEKTYTKLDVVEGPTVNVSDVSAKIKTDSFGYIVFLTTTKVEEKSAALENPFDKISDESKISAKEPSEIVNEVKQKLESPVVSEVSPKVDNMVAENPAQGENPAPLMPVVKVESGSSSSSVKTAKSLPAAVVESAKAAVDKVAETTKEFVESPIGKTTVAVAQPVGVVSGMTLVGTQVALSSATVTSFSDIYLLIVRSFGFLAGFFKRKKRRWGTVYDSKTKRPLDPAIVSIKQDGKEVAGAITDFDGRFGFFVPAGLYTIEAAKSHYVFPSKILAKKDEDFLYDNLYFGGKFDVKEGEVSMRNIPLDPIDFDWNEFEKNKQNLFRFYSKKEKLTSWIFDLVYSAGAFLAIAAAVFDPKPFNYAFLFIYFIIIFYQYILLPGKRAVCVKKANGEHVPYAIIRIFTKDRGEVKMVVTDQMGRFYFLTPPGSYYLTVEERVEDEEYKEIYKSKIFNLPKGVMTRDLVLE